ncbi:MAG: glycosyltransferase family 2 protein [Planctomycetota bacterium]
MISIVIPVFNEEENLPALYERLTAAAAAWEDPDYEVIVVDDGSKDRSFVALADIHRKDPRWKVLSFSRNFGHQSAISAGIHYTTGDVVVVMDADLQDPPEELERFLAKWREGYHVVYAIRTKRKENIFKRTAYAAFYRILRKVSSIEIPLDSGDFCVMDRHVVDVLRAMPERSRFVRGLRSWSGFRQVGVAYERQARHAGEVKYTFSKLVRLAFDGIFSFSNVPLRMSNWLGVSLCAAAACVILMLTAWWGTDVEIFGMRPRQAAGWTSLCSLILLLSGLQFLVLGVMGEYLARMFEEAKARPPWIIGNALGILPAKDHSPVGWFVETPAFSKSGDRQAPYRRAG